MEILPSIETLNYHIYLMNFLVLSLIGSYQSMKHVFFKIRFLSIGICIFPHFFCNSFLISGEILLKKKSPIDIVIMLEHKNDFSVF